MSINENNQNFNPSDVWLTVSEIAKLLNITKNAVRKKLRHNGVITRITDGKWGKEYQFLLSSLPVSVQNIFIKNEKKSIISPPCEPKINGDYTFSSEELLYIKNEKKSIISPPCEPRCEPTYEPDQKKVHSSQVTCEPVHTSEAIGVNQGVNQDKTLINANESKFFNNESKFFNIDTCELLDKFSQEVHTSDRFSISEPMNQAMNLYIASANRPVNQPTNYTPNHFNIYKPMNQTTLIEKIYSNITHELIFSLDGIMPLQNFKANSNGYTSSCPNPSHPDTKPSFLMKQGIPAGKCQSCGYYLTWFDAVALSLGYKDKKLKGKDFWTVINTLSSLSGQTIELSPEQKEHYQLIHEIQELRNSLSIYLHQQLLTNLWAETTQQYLEQRGVPKNYLPRFPMLGFYPQTETVEQYLLSEGFSPETIQESNVLQKYFQNNCLIFSYKDELGNTLGFKGRKPSLKVKDIKYQKGFKGEPKDRAVMGLESCDLIVQRTEHVVCVEGEFDWLTAQVASLNLHNMTGEFVCFGGSDIKPEKLHTLKKAGAKVLYLGFDPDEAGKKATREAIKHAEELGLCVFVIDLPTGIDPDAFIKSHGLAQYQNSVKEAVEAPVWLGKEFLSKYTLTNKESQEKAKIDLISESKNYKGLTLSSFLEITTKALNLDKNYILNMLETQKQEQVKGISALPLKSFLPSAPNAETFLLPSGWILTQQELIKSTYSKNEIKEIPIAQAPFYVSSRSKNLDTRDEKLELTYLRDKHWKTLYEDRSILLDHRKIVQLSSKGFPVNSLNCKEIVHFIQDFEALNDENLPKQTTISGFGWKREKSNLYFVLPNKAYGTDIAINFEPEGLGDEKLAKALRQEGELKLWETAIKLLINHPRAMFHVYAGFTPTILELLDAPNFIIDNWGLTSTGKTTVISITASIWGLPIKEQGGLVLPSDATKVSIERLASLSNHLVILLDDTQTANDKVLSQILYMLANGIGRQRGALKGMQKTSSWRTIAFTTGERQLSEVTEYEGAKARTISLYGSPFGEKRQPELIHKIKSIIHSNYGHAGPIFIQHLINNGYTNSKREELRKDYREITVNLSKLGNDNVSDRIAQYLGAVYVAGKLAEDIFSFGGDVEAVIKEILRVSLGQLKESGDYPQRALELIISWVQSNQNSFDKSELQANVDRGEVYGIIREGEYIGIFPHKVKELLRRNGFSYSTILKTFKERKWIQTSKDQNTYPIGFRSKVIRMIKLQWDSFNFLWS